ncbi:MAG: hypothetical protein R3321_12365 [Nitrososphaeraceae archaeon]|nr:hypothetical protein [Nitrososphaeraceae archaeon]
MMKNDSFSAIPTLYFVILTFLFALLSSVFLDLDNVVGEENFDFVVDSINKIPSHQLIYMACKSPCPPGSEVCIQMCV